MSRSGKNPNERLKSAKGRTASSVRWLSRQLNDPYVKQAKAEGWRSRAAFKLIESFEGLLEREFIKADLERKNLELLAKYGADLRDV